MNALDLLSKWPSWEKAGAEFIFNSPAWAMPVRWRDTPCTLHRADFKERDIIGLNIRFEDENNFLGIGNRSSFPDLSQLWDVKQNMPDALKLALIEKECGLLLQVLENAVRRQLSVSGISPAENREGCTGFEIIAENGKILASFLMKVTPDILRSLGQLKYIDATHPAIREMTRSAVACYASFPLSAEELGTLAAGDFILLPETQSTPPYWLTDFPMDDTILVTSPDKFDITFAQFADDALPVPPTPTALQLMRNGKLIAYGRLATLGNQPAFALEEVF